MCLASSCLENSPAPKAFGDGLFSAEKEGANRLVPVPVRSDCIWSGLGNRFGLVGDNKSPLLDCCQAPLCSLRCLLFKSSAGSCPGRFEVEDFAKQIALHRSAPTS